MILSSFSIILTKHLIISHETIRFTINGPLSPCVYLAPLCRYGTSKIMGSRFWPFVVTWRHSLHVRDYSTSGSRLPIRGPWWQWVYLVSLRRYGPSKILGSRVWPFGVTLRHRSRDHSNPGGRVPMGGPSWPCVHLAPLRRYGASKLSLIHIWRCRRRG